MPSMKRTNSNFHPENPVSNTAVIHHWWHQEGHLAKTAAMHQKSLTLLQSLCNGGVHNIKRPNKINVTFNYRINLITTTQYCFIYYYLFF